MPAVEPAARFLFVRLEADLDRARYVGLFHAIGLHPGVECVVDLAAVSRKTLDGVLLKPTPSQREATTA